MEVKARFAIAWGKLILGKLIDETYYKKGHLYQIVDVLDTPLIQDLGFSAGSPIPDEPEERRIYRRDSGCMFDGHGVSQIICSGDHLFTYEEILKRQELYRREYEL